MQLITANRIHNGHQWLPTESTIVLATDGTIVAILPEKVVGAKHYDGILAPCFVNTHCHLELSHMKGVVPEGSGLIPFLKNIPKHRNDFSVEQKALARKASFDAMLANGIIAVGDIANTTDSLDLRATDSIHFQTFVEALGFNEDSASRAFEYSLDVFDAFNQQNRGQFFKRQSITPHAPYSVSERLFRLIDGHQASSIISIHNQESNEENLFYKNKEGLILELLQSLGINSERFMPTGKGSLSSYIQWLSTQHPFIFVHNTYTTVEDVRSAYMHSSNVYWCLCPNANMYIERRLPDIQMLLDQNAKICIGTDSLASNHQLCILSELLTIKNNHANINWETLIKWGTFNGAEALQMDNLIGSLEIGKKPGLVHIKGVTDSVIEHPTVERIV